MHTQLLLWRVQWYFVFYMTIQLRCVIRADRIHLYMLSQFCLQHNQYHNKLQDKNYNIFFYQRPKSVVPTRYLTKNITTSIPNYKSLLCFFFVSFYKTSFKFQCTLIIYLPLYPYLCCIFFCNI